MGKGGKENWGPSIGRMRFFKLGGTAVAILGLSAIGLHEVTVPPVVEGSMPPRDGIFPGWLEQGLNEPFIQIHDGHFPFVKEAIRKKPQLQRLTQDVFSHLSNLENPQPPGVLLDATYKRAAEILSSEPKEPVTNTEMEAMHLATFALAAAFNLKWTLKDLQELGLPDIVSTKWFRFGVGYKAYPPMFAAKNTEGDEKFISFGLEPHLNGHDRPQHFFSHLMIAFEYLYSQYNSHSPARFVATSMPPVINHLTGAAAWIAPTFPILGRQARMFTATELESVFLTYVTGHVYEIMTTSPEHFKMSPDDITSGIRDSYVDADFKGNHLGAITAIALYRRLNSGLNGEGTAKGSIKPVIDELNEEKFRRYETEPMLETLAA